MCCPLLPAARRSRTAPRRCPSARAGDGGHRPRLAARPRVGMAPSKSRLYGPEPTGVNCWARCRSGLLQPPTDGRTDGRMDRRPRSLHLCQHSAGLSPGSVWDGASLRLYETTREPGAHGFQPLPKPGQSHPQPLLAPACELQKAKPESHGTTCS